MAARKKAQTATKRPRKSPAPKGELVVPEHGRGKIWKGTPANPVAGTGRPRDAVREKLLGITQGKGIGFLSNLMDGKIEVALIGKCPQCDYEGAMPDGDGVQAILDRVTTSVDQRLKGNEQALKYGLGTLKEVSTEQVRERLQQTLQAIRQICTPVQAEQIVNAMRPIWL